MLVRHRVNKLSVYDHRHMNGYMDSLKTECLQQLKHKSLQMCFERGGQTCEFQESWQLITHMWSSNGKCPLTNLLSCSLYGYIAIVRFFQAFTFQNIFNHITKILPCS